MAAKLDPKVGLKVTSYAAIANAPLPYEGNGSFSNTVLVSLVLGVAWLITRFIPYFSFWPKFIFALLISGLPVVLGYWMFMSRLDSRVRQTGILPGKNIEDYMTIKDADLKAKYHGRNKIPMQVFYDAYFDQKIDIKGDMLELLEYRHDWASFYMTWNLLKYVLVVLIPDVINHSSSQDEEQVRDHYDRGDDFYSWFLGPRMIYTSGVISDINKKETLEELQDNKLTLVCEKMDLKPDDVMLDIGCGWGTLVTFAAKNYGCDTTGVTLSKNQAAFGTERIAKNGVSADKARILCKDFRDVGATKKFTKITALEMAEHVGIRRYSQFLQQVYDILEDDGLFCLQVAGIRTNWQYEDLIWGLFMNKYVFPGADASCALNWVIGKCEGVGFEVKSIDVLGVHYSATLHRWYENWKSNEANVKAAYGERWWRVWLYFLASSTIASRQGSASVFQIILHKNIIGFHRIEGVPSHTSLHNKPSRQISPVV